MASRRKAAVLLGLCEMYGKNLGDDAVRLYLAAIEDMSDDDAEYAAAACMRTSKFFPSPAELLDAAGMSEPSKQDVAIRAWESAWIAAGQHGAYESMLFGDVTIARTIRAMGGWVAFCQPTQDVEWHRKEFIETYCGLMGAPDDGRGHALAGVHGASRQPILIGEMPQGERLLNGDVDEAECEPVVGVSKQDAIRLMDEIRKASGAGLRDDCCPSFDLVECSNIKATECRCACHAMRAVGGSDRSAT